MNGVQPSQKGTGTGRLRAGFFRSCLCVSHPYHPAGNPCCTTMTNLRQSSPTGWVLNPGESPRAAEFLGGP